MHKDSDTFVVGQMPNVNIDTLGRMWQLHDWTLGVINDGTITTGLSNTPLYIICAYYFINLLIVNLTSPTLHELYQICHHIHHPHPFVIVNLM